MRFREEQPTDDGSGSETNQSSHEASDEFAQAYEALSRRVAQARAQQHATTAEEEKSVTLGLSDLEFWHLHQIYENLSIPELVEHALMQGEGGLSATGALCIKTAPYTTRSPGNTLIVGLGCPPRTSSGPVALSEPAFRHLYQEAQAYVQGRSLYIVDGTFASTIPIRVVTELASQALFVKQLLYPARWHSFAQNSPEQNSPGQNSQNLRGLGAPLETLSGVNELPITLIVLPGLKGEPSLEPELYREVFTALYPAHRLGMIGGSRCGQEIQAAILHLAEWVLLEDGVLPLTQAKLFEQASEQAGPTRAVTLVLPESSHQEGLLHQEEASSHRSIESSMLVWSAGSLQSGFAGAYGSITNADNEQTLEESMLGQSTLRNSEPSAFSYGFGTILENVVLDATTGVANFSDRRWSATPRGIRPKPLKNLLPQDDSSLRSLVLGLWDAEEIFPPVAKLTIEQVQFYYLCGYGNWQGQGNSSFCACFSPELSIQLAIARVLTLGDRLRQLPASVQYLLVNTASKEAQTIALLNGTESLPQHQSIPILNSPIWQQGLTTSAARKAVAQNLFQRFHDYMQQFYVNVDPQKAEALASIGAAGPRLL